MDFEFEYTYTFQVQYLKMHGSIMVAIQQPEQITQKEYEELKSLPLVHPILSGLMKNVTPMHKLSEDKNAPMNVCILWVYPSAV